MRWAILTVPLVETNVTVGLSLTAVKKLQKMHEYKPQTMCALFLEFSLKELDDVQSAVRRIDRIRWVEGFILWQGSDFKNRLRFTEVTFV